MYRNRELGFLVRYRPDEAEAIIRTAYADGGGLLEQAAIDLGISIRSLQRYLRTLDIWDTSTRSLRFSEPE